MIQSSKPWVDAMYMYSAYAGKTSCSKLVQSLKKCP